MNKSDPQSLSESNPDRSDAVVTRAARRNTPSSSGDPGPADDNRFLQEFKELHRIKTGEVLSDAQAHTRFHRLINLVEAVYKPIRSEQLPSKTPDISAFTTG